jgi:hypothetical protein
MYSVDAAGQQGVGNGTSDGARGSEGVEIVLERGLEYDHWLHERESQSDHMGTGDD